MNTKSKKFKRVISHTENAPWWGDLLSQIVTTGGEIGKSYIEGKEAPEPSVNPNAGNNNNNNNNNDDSNNTLLYVAAGAIVVLLLVVLIKK